MLKTSYNSFITGDAISGRRNKLLYIVFFIVNFIISFICFIPLRVLFSGVFKRHKFKNLSAAKDLSCIFDLNEESISDSRLSCFEFLDNFFEQIIKKEKIQNQIEILDLGFGSGRFYKVFRHFSKKMNFDFNYVGVDIYRHRDISELEKFDNFQFLETDAASFIENNRKHFHLVFSQSVLEHIKNDKEVILSLNRNAVFKESKQIHFVPSLLSFFGYIFHGYRHYSAVNLVFLLGNLFSWKVYPIGNLKQCFLHLRKRLSSMGYLKTNKSTTINMRSPHNNSFFPIFYAITKNE
jgi:SAM-dependent methyltransferase